MARTASYCGLESETEMSTCDVLIGCFEDNETIFDWTTCMENEVRGGTTRMKNNHAHAPI